MPFKTPLQLGLALLKLRASLIHTLINGRLRRVWYPSTRQILTRRNTKVDLNIKATLLPEQRFQSLGDYKAALLCVAASLSQIMSLLPSQAAPVALEK